MNRPTQETLEEIVRRVASEWQVGGMGPDSMYGEFAIEVAKRALAVQPEAEAKILPSPSAIDLIEEAATFIQDNVGIQDAYIDYEGKTKLLRKISVFLDQCGPQVSE